MIKLISVKFSNIRSLLNTDYIDLKPLTILVGKNSVGKSTFARTFPLLRQSSEANKKSPLLWYGKYVDFGDYDTAINKNNKNEGIDLGFKFKFNPVELINIFDESYTLRSQFGYSIHEVLSNAKKSIELEAKLNFHKNKDHSYNYKIDISFLKYKIKIIIENSKIEIFLNNKKYNLNDDKIYKVSQQKLFPSIELDHTNINPNRYKNYFSFFHRLNFSNSIKDQFKKNITDYFERDINEEEYNKLYSNSFYKILERINKKTKLISYPDDLNEEYMDIIEDIFIISKISEILNFIDESLADYFNGVQYLEPLRATAQRYYRKQEFAINEVDSKGSNIAMFMAENHQHKILKQLIKKHFNLEFVTDSNDGGHITLNLLTNHETGEKINLADLGVGYSQLLPVILQLWNAAYNQSKKSTQCLVVEQPELHLHPAYQAKIADITADIIRDLERRKINQNFIFETHSPHLISRLGELIEDKRISKDSVQILIFDNDLNKTTISKATFNEEGVLQNWPFGFFH
ncbi:MULTISPECIES: AAA family ATPase [Acinetobacter calcoaceticus/baumannii complex]|uniref:AAA family ATPase n=1 Tax=Acinetobacter calcoaceticus/baumannii complex TaxID=909768 RepID=UPI001F0518DF|nr:AAA family ATPase [Acinetobacter seifertii]MCH2002812.1 AAA family ATPase [Acinetobacter seifertii]